jgi:hypothetical protein
MYFNHAFRKTLLAVDSSSALAVATTGTTSDLAAGTLGIFDSKFTNIAVTTTTNLSKPFYIVQGSYYKTSGYSDKIGSHGGYQESVKSKMINPKYISRIFWVQSKLPVQQVVQIPATGGLNADTTYRLRIDVKGSPALRFLSHNIYRVMDSYTGPLNATNPTFQKDPIATLVDWKEQITMSPYFNQLVQARVYAFKNNATSTHFTAGTPGVSSTTLTITTSNTGVILPGQRIVASTGVTGLTNVPNIFANYGTSFGTGTTPTTAPTASTTSVTITGTGTGTPTATITVGMYVTGAGLPQGAYLSTVTSQTNYVITYPTQATAPTITGSSAALTFYNTIVLTYPTQASAPTFSSWTIKCYSDLYGNNGGYVTPYTNIAVTSGQQPTYVGQTPYIPGSSAYNTSGLTQTAGTLTGATITAGSTVAAATSGAHIYTASSDASTFTTDAFMELTAAYLETKFGNPTFTVTDNYDLEPLKIIASLMDDSGSTTVTAPIGTAAAQTIGEAGIATVVQASSMAQGTGETVLRELILTGRYRQEAFGDGTNIDQFRMREIEANPSVLDMMSVGKRNSLYNKLCILHSVPRFNNPTGVFDNDQYLIEIALPSTLTIDKVFNGATYTVGGSLTSVGASTKLFGDYIYGAYLTASPTGIVEMI